MQVTDEDRRAAWPFAPYFYHSDTAQAAWMKGTYDGTRLIQAFAEHRLASERRAYENAAECAENLPTPWGGDTLESHAHCVEAGAYSNALEDAAQAIRALATSKAPDTAPPSGR